MARRFERLFYLCSSITSHKIPKYVSATQQARIEAIRTTELKVINPWLA
jgi:hypothetical protein